MGEIKNERLSGLDIIRILAMIFVIAVHVLGVGGATASVQNDMLLKVVLCLLQGISLCCINLFAMSTGFLRYGKKPHLSGLFQLCLQGLFWIMAMLLFYAMFKGDMTIFDNNYKDYLHVLTKRQYWYLSDYVVLFFIIPILNAAVSRIDLKYLTYALLSILFVTSVIMTIVPYTDYVTRGYSAMWLAIMYLVGAYIKKYDLIHKIKTSAALMIFAVFALLECVYAYMSYMMGYDMKDYYYKFSSYNCVFVVGASVALFVALAKINIKSAAVGKVLGKLSSVSLTVYLVHTAPVIFDNCITGRFGFFADYGFFKALAVLAGIVLLIYSVGTVLGLVQDLLFRILHLPNLFRFIENKINMCYDFLYRKLFSKIEE